MNWRTTAVLFVILLLLAGYVYYDSQREPEPDLVDEPAAAPVTERVQLVEGVMLEQVTELTVTRHEDQKTATFFRDTAGEWTQTVPTTTAVVSSTLNTAVSGLLTLSSRRSFEPVAGSGSASALSPYGLADPAAFIALTYLAGESPQSVGFNIGSQTPAEDAYYLLREGDTRVHLVPPFSIDNITVLIDEPPLPTPTAAETMPITDTVPTGSVPTGTVPVTTTVP